MCLSVYWLHTTVIRRDRSRGKMIPNIIFITFVNLRKDSPANILFASKERLYYLDNRLLPLIQGVPLSKVSTFFLNYVFSSGGLPRGLVYATFLLCC